MNKQIIDKQREYNQAKLIVVDPENELRERYKDKLKEYKTDLKKLKDAFKIAKAELELLKTVISTYEKYFELFDNVTVLIRSTKSNMVINKSLKSSSRT